MFVRIWLSKKSNYGDWASICDIFLKGMIRDLPQVITWVCLDWLVLSRVLSSINALAKAYAN